MAIRQRVLAYVTREKSDVIELLVFAHADFPDAGIQVPAGGVEPGETLEEAVVREIWEETGIANARVVRKLAEEINEAGSVNNHIYHLIGPKGLADTWDWLTNDYHNEEYRARGESLVFRLFWIDLARGADVLAGGQGRWLDLINQRGETDG